ncbi:hypothetical protein Tco_1047214 [Tanacetum coccineum]
MSKDDDDNADNEDDDEEIQDEEDKDKESSDLRVQTPSHFESTDEEAYDEVTQGDIIEGEELDEEETNEEEEVNELNKDVNINLERRDTEMTDALQTNQSSYVSSGFISNMLNPNPDTGIDSILNLNTESTSLVDVPVTTNAEMPPSSVITLLPPPIPLIQSLHQTPISTPTIAPNRLKEEAHAENEDFINKINENIKKISKEQVKAQVKEQVSKILLKIKKSVSEQLKAEILIRSSNKAKTS